MCTSALVKTGRGLWISWAGNLEMGLWSKECWLSWGRQTAPISAHLSIFYPVPSLLLILRRSRPFLYPISGGKGTCQSLLWDGSFPSLSAGMLVGDCLQVWSLKRLEGKDGGGRILSKKIFSIFRVTIGDGPWKEGPGKNSRRWANLRR